MSTEVHQQTETAPAHYHFDSVGIIAIINAEERRHSGGGLTIDRKGITVTPPGHHPSTTIPWTRVHSVEAGPAAMFDDGSPATTIDVVADDRFMRFLVPSEQLASWQVGVLQLLGNSPTQRGPGPVLPGIAPFRSA